MWSTFFEIASGPNIFYLAASFIVLGLVLSPLEKLYPANRQKLFDYKGAALDRIYWFVTPIFTRTATNFVIAPILFAIYYLQGYALDASLLEGFGPLSHQPKWLQAFEVLLISDFIDYWTHRIFHTSMLWPIHAVHHSPEQMTWVSSSRMHPLNDLVTRICQVIPIAMLGFSGKAILMVLPYLFFYVVFLHSNLSWSFGPFRKILVSPAYHRWHHTTDAEGLDKNFAGIFPIWDILFGTYHFPEDRLPKNYGVLNTKMPETLAGQLMFPFRALRKRSPNPTSGALESKKNPPEDFSPGGPDSATLH